MTGRLGRERDATVTDPAHRRLAEVAQLGHRAGRAGDGDADQSSSSSAEAAEAAAGWSDRPIGKVAVSSDRTPADVKPGVEPDNQTAARSSGRRF